MKAMFKKTEFWEALSGVLLFFGASSWIFFAKSEGRKRKAQADVEAIHADRDGFELRKDQYDYIYDRLTKLQKEYLELGDKFQEQMRRGVEILNQKHNEIAELKIKLTHYEGLRCYRADCPNRILANTPPDTVIPV